MNIRVLCLQFSFGLCSYFFFCFASFQVEVQIFVADDSMNVVGLPFPATIYPVVDSSNILGKLDLKVILTPSPLIEFQCLVFVLGIGFYLYLLFIHCCN